MAPFVPALDDVPRPHRAARPGWRAWSRRTSGTGSRPTSTARWRSSWTRRPATWCSTCSPTPATPTSRSARCGRRSRPTPRWPAGWRCGRRRLVGEALSQAQRVAAERDALAELLVGGTGDLAGSPPAQADHQRPHRPHADHRPVRLTPRAPRGTGARGTDARRIWTGWGPPPWRGSWRGPDHSPGRRVDAQGHGVGSRHDTRSRPGGGRPRRSRRRPAVARDEHPAALLVDEGRAHRPGPSSASATAFSTSSGLWVLSSTISRGAAARRS